MQETLKYAAVLKKLKQMPRRKGKMKMMRIMKNQPRTSK